MDLSQYKYAPGILDYDIKQALEDKTRQYIVIFPDDTISFIYRPHLEMGSKFGSFTHEGKYCVVEIDEAERLVWVEKVKDASR